MTNTALAQPKLSALNLMASKFSVEPDKLLGTLKGTVFKGATNEELLALVVVANSYGLNPLTKEIYAFPAKGGGIVPVVSVDGWIRMTNDHPQCDGIEFESQHDSEGRLVAVTCKIHRKDRSHPTIVTEYLAECRRNTEPWKMEHRMLRHKALIQCARVAFGFSGIHDEDEAKDIAGMRNVTPSNAVAPSFVLPAAEPAKKQSKKEPEAEPELPTQPEQPTEEQDEIPY
jgi:phage recombination protein Bet